MHHLIGRDADVAALDRALFEQRLVTILGPGGIGKTSLARTVTTDRSTMFVELSNLTTSADFGDLVSKRMGFNGLAEMLNWLDGEPSIIVLDTCEHVIDGAAAIAMAVLDQTRAGRVLATSRIPLDVPHEFMHVLAPLAVEPELGADGTKTSPAVQLFQERARDGGAPDAVVNDVEAVTRLCQRLDGMPLAIELAAARARSMSPDEMLRHLDDGVEVLARPRFRGESRHRSLRSAIDWSFNLLELEERALFRKLAVFPSRFDADMVHDVADEGERRLHTADLLAVLVDHSLVAAEVGDGSSRFRLFDTTRAYAEARLEEAGETESATEAYVDAVCAQAAASAKLGGDDWDTEAFRSLVELVEDYLAATRIAVGDDEPTRAFGLLTALWGIVPHAHGAEIAELGLTALGRWPEPTARRWPEVAATTATALREVGRNEEALELATDALGHANDRPYAEVLLHRIIALIVRREDPTSAATHARAAITAAERANLSPNEREMRIVLAQIHATQGRTADALAITQAVVAETTPTDLNHMFALLVEGMAVLIEDPDGAGDSLRLALQLSERAGYIIGVGMSLRLLALRSLQIGDNKAAAQYVLSLLRHVHTTRNLGEQGIALLIGTAVLRVVDHDAIDEIIARARSWSAASILESGSLDDLSVLDTNIGRSIAPSRALQVCRAALEEVAAAGRDEPDLSPEPTPSDPAPGSNSDSQVKPTARLERIGENWSTTFGGRTSSLRHSKGLADIATLIASQGREIHIFDLVGAGVVEGAADVVADASAMDAYRDRIRDLQEELAEADDTGDIGKSERAQYELDALIEQLSAAAGLGGRARRTSSTAERARSTVTKRIRAAVKKLATAHPELGRHLDASLSTGIFCKYDPEQPVDWVVRSEQA